MCLKHLMSSAKSRALLSVIELDRSFINMIKRSGLRILPWGTPDSTDDDFFPYFGPFSVTPFQL